MTAYAITALAIFALYLFLGFGIRTWLQVRRTGDSGFRGISGRVGSPEWWAGVLFVVALVAGLLGPVAALLGLDPLGVLRHSAVQVTGLALAVLGIVATVLTQLDMGSSWRIGVDASEHTDLVTSGAFRLVRNPIFTAMAITGIGLALLVPNLVALAGAVLLVVALHLQVRVVEEPYLVRVHESTYHRVRSPDGPIRSRHRAPVGALPTAAGTLPVRGPARVAVAVRRPGAGPRASGHGWNSSTLRKPPLTCNVSSRVGNAAWLPGNAPTSR